MSARSRVSARWLFALLLVVLFLLPSGPVAADAPPLSLADDGTISVTWKDIIAGKPVAQILNLTMAPLSVDVVLDEAGLANAADAAKPRLGGPDLVTAYTGRTVPAGGMWPVVLATGDQPMTPAAGVYQGWLTVRCAEPPYVLHRAITIVAPEPEGAGALTAARQPVPLLDSWSVWLVRYGGPFGGPATPSFLRADEAFLPVNVARDQGGVSSVPQPLGTLTSEQDGLATVSYAGAFQVLSNDKYGIALAYSDIDRPARYSGKIDTLPADKDKGAVSLTVNVTDFVGWAVVALLLGLALAYGVERALNVKRNVLLLLKDEADNAAPGALKLAYQHGQESATLELAGFAAQQELLRKDIDRLRGTFWHSTLLDATAPAYVALVQRSARLDASARAWQGLGGALDDLQAALLALSPQDGSAAAAVSTALWQDAAKLFTSRKLATDEAIAKGLAAGAEPLEDYSARVNKATALAKSWAQWHAAEVKLSERLAAAAQALGSQLPARVEEARFELSRLATWLQTHGLDDLDATRLSESLVKADGLVAGLEDYGDAPLSGEQISVVWDRIKAGLSAGQLKGLALPTRFAGGATAPQLWGEIKALGVAVDPAAFAAALADRAPRAPWPALKLYPVDGLPAEPAPRLVRIRQRLVIGDGVLLALEIIVAVWTGLAALYLGKTWGSLTDYIAAVAWGFGATAALKVIYGALNRALGVNEAR